MRALALAVLAVMPRLAFAVDFDVSPVRLDLSERARTGHLTVRNPGAQPLRLQVMARAWDQSPEGRIELGATDEVSLFPSIFVLAPGQSRVIRVGVSGAEAGLEKTFRVLIDELPETQGVAGAIQVVTRLSVPIFFGHPGNGRAEIVEPRMDRGIVSFAVKNGGEAHVMAKAAVVVARDADGREVARGTQQGWYVLAGGVRQFVVPLGEGGERTVRFGVRVETDVGLVEADVRVP